MSFGPTWKKVGDTIEPINDVKIRVKNMVGFETASGANVISGGNEVTFMDWSTTLGKDGLNVGTSSKVAFFGETPVAQQSAVPPSGGTALLNRDAINAEITNIKNIGIQG